MQLLVLRLTSRYYRLIRFNNNNPEGKVYSISYTNRDRSPSIEVPELLLAVGLKVRRMLELPSFSSIQALTYQVVPILKSSNIAVTSPISIKVVIQLGLQSWIQLPRRLHLLERME